MSSHTNVLHAYSPEEFCHALKSVREQQGLSLDVISEATKIPAYLFAGLERNDLRRWPTGLFRRSFFRDYAHAIGLPVSEACAAFARLFPEAAPEPAVPQSPAAPLKPSVWFLLQRWFTDTQPRHSRSGIRLRIKVRG